MFNTEKFIKKSEKRGDIPRFSRVSKDVIKFVTPTIIEAILFSFAVIVDGIMISSYSNNATAAITTTKQPILLMISFITALTICSISLIGRKRGENDEKGANNIFHTQLQFTIIFAAIIGLIFFIFKDQIVYLMGARGQVSDYASSYLGIHSLFFMFNALRLSINAAQKAVGNAKISMISNVVANIINIILNYCLIYGNFGFPELGIVGAAIATVTSYFIAFLITIASLKSRNGFLKFSITKLFKFEKKSFNSIKKMYPSTFVDQAFIRIGFIITSMLINYLGTDAQYVNGVCFDILGLAFSVSDGFSVGLSALVAINIGKNRPDLVIVISKVTLILSFILINFVALFMYLFNKQIIELYSPETEEIKLFAMNLMNLVIIAVFFQNIQWVSSGIIKGAGDTKYNAKTSFMSILIIRPLATFVLCYLTPLGLVGAWVAMILDQIVRMFRNLTRFLSRKFLN